MGLVYLKQKYDMEDKLKHIDPEDIIKIINVNNNHTTPPQTRIIVFYGGDYKD